MIIGVTKKAQPLFSDLPSVKDKEYGQQFAQINPLFSWHANYINVNRKKVIILLNNQTLTPIILQDINAQKKKQLSELIPEAIRIAFEIAGISSKKIDEYLKIAGDTQVTATSNRSVLGSVNLVIEELSDFRLNINQTINREVITYYSNYIHSKLSKQGYFSSAEALRDALSKSLEVLESFETEPYLIEKTWDYSKFSQVGTSNFSLYQWERHIEASIKNNEKLLTVFKEYTMAVKGLSEKTIERHMENLNYYLNIYLIEYEQATPVHSTEAAGNFLSSFFVKKNLASSSASLKQCGSSLKKLYQFLYEAGEISKTDLAEINESIKLGVQEGIEYLGYTEDSGSWF